MQRFILVYFASILIVLIGIITLLVYFGVHQPKPTPQVTHQITTMPYVTTVGNPVAASTPAAFFGTLADRQDNEICINNLKQIGMAMEKYKLDHNGELPDFLSDLIPKYIKDEKVFLCDHVNDSPLSSGSQFGETKIETNYLYDFSAIDSGRGGSYKDWKTGQLDEFGDKVPVVRCWKHAESLNLTYGGEILFYELIWENSVPPGTMIDLDVHAREYLRKMALAIEQYKKDKGEVPNELEDLFPDYVRDAKELNPLPESLTVSYQFTPNRLNQQTNEGETYREWKLLQRENFGDYVPLIRVRGNFVNADVINLSYGLEIYESSGIWEEDLIPGYQAASQ